MSCSSMHPASLFLVKAAPHAAALDVRAAGTTCVNVACWVSNATGIGDICPPASHQCTARLAAVPMTGNVDWMAGGRCAGV